LRAAEPLTIAVVGDSISEGYSASGFEGVPPFQPPYPALVVAGLADAYRSPITLHNLAVAGSTADNGRWETGQVSAAHPDLVVVAYGMNDAGYALPEDFSANIAATRREIREARPEAEFVLVSPMLPNPDWDYPVMSRFAAYRNALAGLCDAGTVLADVTSVWTALLHRKTVYDLTANGLNHPNDFGHYVYAQVILALLTRVENPASAPT
jgi:lysophospholipase L1-like esterase